MRESSLIPAEPCKSFEFSCADYGFMVVLAALSFSESFGFPAMIQHMIFDISFFTGYLEFVPKSSIRPVERLDVCPRHPVYIIFPFIHAYSVLYLPVAHDNLTKQIQFVITILNLLHTHVIFCRNSQMIMR